MVVDGWVVVQPIPLSLPTWVEVELGCDKNTRCFLHAHSFLCWKTSKIFDFELKLKKLWRKLWGREEKNLRKILGKKCLFIPLWFPRTSYGCPMEIFGSLMKSLWPHLVLYGSPTGLKWSPLALYGPIWPTLVFIWLNKGQIWPHMNPNESLLASRVHM